MSQYLIIFIALYYIGGVNSYIDLNIQPCKRNDEVCITNISRKLYNKVIEGDPSIHLKSSDPVHKKIIQGNLVLLNYSLTDSTLTGFKNCEVARASLELKKSLLHYDIICPFLSMVGKYDINGNLLGFPIRGNGDYLGEARDYRSAVDVDTTLVTGSDGIQYLKFKSFRVNSDLRGGMLLDMRNLFNGNKELGDAVLKFANENWRPVSKFLEAPVINSYIKKLFSNFNKMLSHIPLNKMIV